MRNEDRKLLTLEERLELAAKSQAASPESAACMVRRLSVLHTAHILCGKADLDLLYGQIVEFLNQADMDLLYYSGFCRSFQMAINAYNSGPPKAAPECPPEEDSSPFRPLWGVGVNNALVLLGLILLDHAKGRAKFREAWHCTQMTLGQYLDAVMALNTREDERQGWSRAEDYRNWSGVFRKTHEEAAPLSEALTDILRRYMAAWQEFNDLDCVLRCGYTGELPDPGGSALAAGAIRGQILLSERDYSPKALRALAAESASSDTGDLVETYISEKWLVSAMQKIDEAVGNLYMLLVEPYLRIRK